MKFKIILYETNGGNKPLEKYLTRLVKKRKFDEFTQIKLYINNLSEYGFDINKKTSPESIKKIDGKLYELRPGNNRVLFFFINGDEFILLHAFPKRTRKTPKKEIDKAKTEMKEYKRRKENEK